MTDTVELPERVVVSASDDRTQTQTHAEYIRADVAAAQLAERDARIAELEAAQRWVSVDERLPDDDEVLTYERDKYGYDVWSVDWYSLARCGWLNDSTPTHWMPLPPPPVTDVTP